MNEYELLNELIEKAFTITNRCYENVLNEKYELLDRDIENRGKILDIIQTIQERINIKTKNGANLDRYNNQVNQVISKIQLIDENMLKLLLDVRKNTQNQIAKTYKNKENLRGYNLNKLNE